MIIRSSMGCRIPVEKAHMMDTTKGVSVEHGTSSSGVAFCDLAVVGYSWGMELLKHALSHLGAESLGSPS